MKPIEFPRRWTLQQQLTILIVFFLCLGGAGLWLLAELLHSREGAVTDRTQAELARADARLIKEFSEANIRQVQTPSKKWDDQLWQLSSEALASFSRVEGGFYLFEFDQLLGYAYPTHGGPVPKRDIPPAERGTILELARRAIWQGLPQERVLHPGLDIVVLRADPLPGWGAVWTMKRIQKPGDARPKILTTLVILMVLIVVAWTVYITLQLRQGVQQLQQGIKAIEEGNAEYIPPLPAEMGLVGSAINTMHQRRQELEQRLRRVDRLASLGQLVAGVAHEVRNPLASMQLNLQYAARQLQKQESTNLPIPSMIEQLDRLESLVRRLLYFDKTQQEEELAPTSLEAIAEESVSLLRLRSEQQGINLVYLSPFKPLPVVPLRRRGLGQVMVNLILNAIQVSPTDGQVEVGVEQRENYLVAWVEDQGSGISSENRERIFDPFFSTKPEVTGLGLSISHEIVTQHGGYIDLKSRPGCTRFSVYLPYSLSLLTADSEHHGKDFDH